MFENCLDAVCSEQCVKDKDTNEYGVKFLDIIKFLILYVISLNFL